MAIKALTFQTPLPFVLKIKNVKRNIGGDCIPLENLSIARLSRCAYFTLVTFSIMDKFFM
jgi:hypothetical protein